MSGAANALAEAFKEPIATLPPVEVVASPLTDAPLMINEPIPRRLPTHASCEDFTGGYGSPNPNFVNTYEVNVDWGCDHSYERTAWILEYDGSCMDRTGARCRWYVEGYEVVVIFPTLGIKFRGYVSGQSLIGRMTARDCRTGCWAATGYMNVHRPNPRPPVPVPNPTRQQYASPN